MTLRCERRVIVDYVKMGISLVYGMVGQVDNDEDDNNGTDVSCRFVPPLLEEPKSGMRKIRTPSRCASPLHRRRAGEKDG